MIGLPLTNRPFGEIGRTLVQKNLLARILQMPGARSLPPDEAPGKAANRFKDDAFEMPLFGLWLNDLLGSLAQVIFAVSLMLYINARITVIVVLPMLVVLVIANLATGRTRALSRGLSRGRRARSAALSPRVLARCRRSRSRARRSGWSTHFKRLNNKRRDAGLGRPAV